MDFHTYRRFSALDMRLQLLDALNEVLPAQLEIDPHLTFDKPDPTDRQRRATFGTMLDTYLVPEYSNRNPGWFFPKPETLRSRLHEVRASIPLMVEEGLISVGGLEVLNKLTEVEPVSAPIGEETALSLARVGIDVSNTTRGLETIAVYHAETEPIA
jgi:hypothetical protein